METAMDILFGAPASPSSCSVADSVGSRGGDAAPDAAQYAEHDVERNVERNAGRRTNVERNVEHDTDTPASPTAVGDTHIEIESGIYATPRKQRRGAPRGWDMQSAREALSPVRSPMSEAHVRRLPPRSRFTCALPTSPTVMITSP